MDFKNGVINIQAAAYNGACTVPTQITIQKSDCDDTKK